MACLESCTDVYHFSRIALPTHIIGALIQVKTSIVAIVFLEPSFNICIILNIRCC